MKEDKAEMYVDAAQVEGMNADKRATMQDREGLRAHVRTHEISKSEHLSGQKSAMLVLQCWPSISLKTTLDHSMRFQLSE